MENSNNTGKILVFFTAIVFLFFVYEVMTNTNKVSQVNVPLKQPSEIVININEKNNNKNNSPAPPPPPPSPTPPAPAPVPPAPVPPAPVPPAPVPVPVRPASICNCRPIITSCGTCIPEVPEQDAGEPLPCENYNKNTCEIANNNCRWDSSDCSLCTSYTDETNCNSAQQDCFWGCTTR